jgi:hypothetical protein
MWKNQRMPAKGINCQHNSDLGDRLSRVGMDWIKGVSEETYYSVLNLCYIIIL